MSRHGYYGSKCHKCAHLDGPTHDSEIVWPVERDDCPTCSFCQSNAFIGALLRVSGAFDIMPADYFAAIKAFKAGEPHPLIDRLRAEMLRETIDWRGAQWFVADARYDEAPGGVGSHWHLTLVEEVDPAAPVPHEGDD